MGAGVSLALFEITRRGKYGQSLPNTFTVLFLTRRSLIYLQCVSGRTWTRMGVQLCSGCYAKPVIFPWSGKATNAQLPYILRSIISLFRSTSLFIYSIYSGVNTLLFLLIKVSLE